MSRQGLTTAKLSATRTSESSDVNHKDCCEPEPDEGKQGWIRIDNWEFMAYREHPSS